MTAAEVLDGVAVGLPCAADGVDRWFEPLLAQRLAQAGMGTLGALAQRINEAGARWWYPVRGMGVTRAARVVQWLQAQPGELGRVPDSVSMSTSALSRADTAEARNARMPSAPMPSGHPWSGLGPTTIGCLPLA